MPVRHVVERAAGTQNTLAAFRKELVRTGLALDLQRKTHIARRPQSRAQKRKRFVRQQKKTRRVDLGTQAAAFVVWQHNAEQLAKKGVVQTASSRCVICKYKMHGAIAQHERESREWADTDDKKFDVVFVDGEGWAHRACEDHVKEHGVRPESIHEKMLRIKAVKDAEAAASLERTRQRRNALRRGSYTYGPDNAQGAEVELVDIDNARAKLDGARLSQSSSSSSSPSSDVAEEKNVAEVLESALPTMPIEEVAKLINRHVGWEFLSSNAVRELRRGKVHTLHRLRVLTDKRWANLPFSPVHRELIQKVVGEEPAYHIEFLKDYRFDRANPRLLTNSMDVAPVTDQELMESTSMPATLQKQVDRERVFSFREEFREEVTPVARPYAPEKQKARSHADPNATFHTRYQMTMPVKRIWDRENTKYHDNVSTSVSKRRDMLKKAYEESTKEEGAGGMAPPVMEINPRPFSGAEQKKMKMEKKLEARGGRGGKKS